MFIYYMFTAMSILILYHISIIQLNYTPLHYAAEYGQTAVAVLLLQAGADRDAKNRVSTF